MTNKFSSTITISFNQNNRKQRIFLTRANFEHCTVGSKIKSPRMRRKARHTNNIPFKRPCQYFRVGSLRGNKKTLLSGYSIAYEHLQFQSLLTSTSPHLLYSGSNLSCLLRLLSLVGLPILKNAGANSTSHFGSTVVTSLMYSLVVRTSSWYTTHSGCLLNSALDGWMYTTWLSVTVRYPSCGSFLAALRKKPLVIAFCARDVVLPQDTTSSLCL